MAFSLVIIAGRSLANDSQTFKRQVIMCGGQSKVFEHVFSVVITFDAAVQAGIFAGGNTAVTVKEKVFVSRKVGSAVTHRKLIPAANGGSCSMSAAVCPRSA